MYSSGNIDVRNWVHLFESPCTSAVLLDSFVNILQFFLCATCGGTFWTYRIFNRISPTFRKRKQFKILCSVRDIFIEISFWVFLAFPIQCSPRMRQNVAQFRCLSKSAIIISWIAFNTHNNKYPLSTTQKFMTAKLSILTQEIAILWHLELETSLCLFSFTGKCGDFKYAFVYRASANLFSESSAIRTSLSNGSLPTVTSTF